MKNKKQLQGKHKKLLLKNEAEANRFTSKILFLLSIIYFVIGICNFFGILASKSKNLYITFLGCGLVMVVVSIVFQKIKAKQSKGLKYYIFFLISFSVLVLNIVTGYKLWLLYSVVILLSLRYYDKRFTCVTAGFVEMMTIASAYTNAYFAKFLNIVDMNLVSFAEPANGKSNTIEFFRWVYTSAVIHMGYDPETVFLNGLRLSVIPNTIIIILITLIALYLIDNALSLLIAENESHQREIELLFESNTDSMTGLLNRRAYIEDRADFIENNAQNFVYVMFDVNGLKYTNDTLGHEAGDELIRGAAFCIKEAFGNYGKIYRWGGDEFVALISTNLDELCTISANFEYIVNNWSGKYVKNMSISSGFVTAWEPNVPKDLADIEALADKRMYEIKQQHYRGR